MYFAEENKRVIPKEDKIFRVVNLAKARQAEIGAENVIAATLGALFDDNGKMVVIKAVTDIIKELDPEDYAAYAPICGIPAFRAAVQKAAFGNFKPSCYTDAVASPGGTGAIRNAIANYSRPGDLVLTHDWFWGAYKTIAQEIGRDIATFTFFDEKGKFNGPAFDAKVRELLDAQGRLVVILNTPAHNPTGYALDLEDWGEVLDTLKKTATGDKKVALVVDMAYIDFAGDKDKYRAFLPLLEGLPENILPLLAYSMSKTFTLYGMRGGALICMAPTPEIAEEFRMVCEFSARGSWSNCARAPQVMLAKLYEHPELLAQVDAERKVYTDMLVSRGKAFEEEAKKVGLQMVPFDTGFFCMVPHPDPEGLAERLRADEVFVIPFAKGVRVSIASVSEAECRKLPALIKNRY